MTPPKRPNPTILLLRHFFSTIQKSYFSILKSSFSHFTSLKWNICKNYPIIKNNFYNIPQSHVKLSIGLILVFGGGSYPYFMTLLVGFRTCGGCKVVEDVRKLIGGLIEKSHNVRTNEDDGDLFKLLIKDLDYEQLRTIILSIYTLILSLISILNINLARITSYSLQITNILLPSIQSFLQPSIQYLTRDPTIITILLKSLSHLFTFFLSYHCQYGTLMISTSIMGANMIVSSLQENPDNKKKLLNPYDIKEIYDKEQEDMIYILALFGIFIQYNCGWKVPFPLNVVLFPVKVVEYYLNRSAGVLII